MPRMGEIASGRRHETDGRPCASPVRRNRLLAAKLGVDPHRSVVVEDAAVGVEAGRRGGMRTIAITGPHGPLDADVVVASMTDLPPDVFDRLVPAD